MDYPHEVQILHRFGKTRMSEKFEQRMQDREVAKDTRTLADLVAIYCRGNHRESVRRPVGTRAARLGVYGRKTPVLCAECEAHLAYGEARRAFCPKDPKPFCANCDVHCYKSDEREWQRLMMRYSGRRSMLHGHAIDGVKHLVETKRHERAAEKAERVTHHQTLGEPQTDTPDRPA